MCNSSKIEKLNILSRIFYVTSGAMSIKISIFFLNLILLKNVNEIESSEISKIFAFGFSWASLIYFSSSRYVAKKIIMENANIFDLMKIVSILGILIFPLISIIAFLNFKNQDVLFIINLLIMLLSIALFDFFCSTLNYLGNNKIFALCQSFMGGAIAISTLLIFFDFNKYSGVILYIVPIVAIFIAVFSFFYIKRISKKEKSKNINFFNNVKELIFFSTPALLGAIFVNPLILWAILVIGNINEKDFVMFIACLNFLGLVMLIPGQVNTISFNFLARKSLKGNKLILLISIVTTIVVLFIVNMTFPYLSFMYGEHINEMKWMVFFMTLCSIPHILTQYIMTRLFLNGSPWKETFGNIAFGIAFCVGCFLFSYFNLTMLFLSIILLFCYFLRLILLIFIYNFEKNENLVGL